MTKLDRYWSRIWDKIDNLEAEGERLAMTNGLYEHGRRQQESGYRKLAFVKGFCYALAVIQGEKRIQEREGAQRQEI